jgi:hypothetical protein
VIEELQFIEEIEVNENFYQPKVSSCQWIAPGPNQYKINVDVAVDRVGVRGSVGAICKDVKGVFIPACVRIIPHITDPETQESIACYEALALAEDCCIRKMKAASVCLRVINNINEIPRSPYMMILQEIPERSKSFDFVRFVHEGRDCNREVHRLAKHACNLEYGQHVWLVSPPVILDGNI